MILTKPENLDVYKTIKCEHCHTVIGYEKFSCGDCKHHFMNPFDEMYCSLKHNATRVCKDFKLDAKRVEYR